MVNPLEDMLKECEDSTHCKYSKFKVIKDVLEKIVTSQTPFDASVLNVQGAFFNDHGKDHFERIEGHYYNLMQEARIDPPLSYCEIYLGLLSIWLHDIGLFLGRKKGESAEDARKYHHERVKDVIDHLTDNKIIGKLDTSEETLLEKICSGHSRKINLNSITETTAFNGETIRPRLLSAILRISDSVDADHRRAPSSIFELFEDFIPPESLKHWNKHKPISGILFNRNHASVDIEVTFEHSLENLIEQNLLVNWVVKEIKDELRSVKEVFDRNQIPFHNVNLKDLATGNYIDSEIDISTGYVRIGMDEEVLDNNVICKLSQILKSNSGENRVFLEIYLKEGDRVVIPLPDEYNVDSSGDFDNSLKSSCNLIFSEIREDAKSMRMIRK
ncbi:MAG: HD domain-containing protein [Nitrosotalea sp.]